jgi:hypothetical protein
MTGWIDRRIEKASWTGFIVWFAILFAFSTWAFNMNSPWTRALKQAGGALPETQPGIPAIEPARSLAALGDDTGDYLLWQALDIPYALFNLMAISIAMGLALKAIRSERSPLRFLLLLPAIYLICELVENSLVAAFASGVLAPGESVVLIQQLATTVKFGTGMPALLLGMLSIVVASVAGLSRLVRSRK